jgi:hypothetical protein
MIKKLLREPLVHFLILGAALFLASSLMNRHTSGDSRKIVISQGQIEHLEDTFMRANQRMPSDEELQGLLRDYIRGEVYYREALALGLDRDDAPIRQRLRSKMEFISEDIAAQAEPTDDQLRSYLKYHPDKFRVEQRFTLSQIYLNPDRHGNHVADDARQLLAKLSQTEGQKDISELGDPFLLEPKPDDVSSSEVARDFGDKFVAAIENLPVGKWQGPIESGLGVHLVLIRKRTDGRIPQLDEVRAAVRREWANDYRVEANEKFYESLLKRYTVIFEYPETVSGEKVAARAGRQ